MKKGDLGGFVESEGNLSFERDDDAWIYHDAIVCNDAYVDGGSILRHDAIACDSAYVSQGAVLFDNARAEDCSYIRGAGLYAHARASGHSMIMRSQESHASPYLTGPCSVYGTVVGGVKIDGSYVVFNGEEIRNDSPDTLVIRDGIRSVIRDLSREKIAPSIPKHETERPHGKGWSR